MPTEFWIFLVIALGITVVCSALWKIPILFNIVVGGCAAYLMYDSFVNHGYILYDDWLTKLFVRGFVIYIMISCGSTEVYRLMNRDGSYFEFVFRNNWIQSTVINLAASAAFIFVFDVLFGELFYEAVGGMSFRYIGFIMIPVLLAALGNGAVTTANVVVLRGRN